MQIVRRCFAAVVIIFCALVGAAVALGPTALSARPMSALTRSNRLAYRDGRSFMITLHRETGFPTHLGAFRKVVCTFTPTSGPVVIWEADAALYTLHPAPEHATFGFRARGMLSGQLRITVDDDEIGPIPVDPTTADPCPTPGPVGTKPRM